MNKFTNILLAEDDLDDYKYLVEAFHKLSPEFKIDRAVNGLECITYLKTKEIPHVVFLDLNMPIKSGMECLKFIRQNDQFNHLPVVIYSTSHYIRDIDTAYKSGANFYIVKPANGENISDILSLAFFNLNESTDQPRKEEFVLRTLATT